MAYLKIDDEYAKFLLELSREIVSQDNRITPNPRFYVVEHEEVVTGFIPEYCDDNLYFDHNSCDYLTKEQACTLYNIDIDDKDADIKLDQQSKLELCGYQTVLKRKNCFLTEKAINKHIEENKHRYKNPRSYLDYADRNPELDMLIKSLQNIYIMNHSSMILYKE